MKNKMTFSIKTKTLTLTTFALLQAFNGWSAPQESSNANDASAAEQLDVNSIKQKYWARGDQTELGVIQNRTYSKQGKIELTPTFGIVTSDPFLYDIAAGAVLGYHISEYFAVYAFGYKHQVSPSSALAYLEAGNPATGQLGTTAETNIPSYYIGGEATASLFYGKLSLLGKSIIYYDFHTLAGMGVTKTESGSYLTPSLGLGQRFHISKMASLRIDYRLQFYRETILEKVVTAQLGKSLGERSNWSNVITLGLSFMFGG